MMRITQRLEMKLSLSGAENYNLANLNSRRPGSLVHQNDNENTANMRQRHPRIAVDRVAVAAEAEGNEACRLDETVQTINDGVAHRKQKRKTTADDITTIITIITGDTIGVPSGMKVNAVEAITGSSRDLRTDLGTMATASLSDGMVCQRALVNTSPTHIIGRKVITAGSDMMRVTMMNETMSIVYEQRSGDVKRSVGGMNQL